MAPRKKKSEIVEIEEVKVEEVKVEESVEEKVEIKDNVELSIGFDGLRPKRRL